MEQVPSGCGSGFVSCGSTAGHLSQMICAATGQRSETCSVAEGASDGDLVVFYFAKPVEAFLGYGRVIRWWQARWNEKPLAEVGMIRLFPLPVTLKRAKERLGLPWLRAAQGFTRRRQENVAMLLALGGVSWAYVLPIDRMEPTKPATPGGNGLSHLIRLPVPAERGGRSSHTP
jgi:hypothetical protein